MSINKALFRIGMIVWVVSLMVGTQFLLLPDFAYAKENIKCEFSADKYEVSSSNDIVTLTWKTENADNVYITYLGSVVSDGSTAVSSIYQDTEFVLTAQKGDKIKECKVEIKFNGDSANTPSNIGQPSCSIRAIPQEIPGTGSSVLLVWDSENTSRAWINNDIGQVHKTGSKVVNGVSGTTVFKMTVESNGVKNTCSDTVYLNPNLSKTAPTCEIAVVGNRIIDAGSATTLKWRTSGSAVSAYMMLLNPINPKEATNMGAVQLKSEMVVSPERTTKYLLQVEDENGNTGFCEQIIEVRDSIVYNSNTYQSNNLPQNYASQYSYANSYLQSQYQTYYTGAYAQLAGAHNQNMLSVSHLPYTGPELKLAYLVVLLISLALISALASLSFVKRVRLS